MFTEFLIGTAGLVVLVAILLKRRVEVKASTRGLSLTIGEAPTRKDRGG